MVWLGFGRPPCPSCGTKLPKGWDKYVGPDFYTCSCGANIKQRIPGVFLWWALAFGLWFAFLDYMHNLDLTAWERVAIFEAGLFFVLWPIGIWIGRPVNVPERIEGNDSDA